MVDPHRAARLREARIAAGFATAVDASTRFGWRQSTYSSHENGTRGISHNRILAYARAFRVRPDWLAFGDGLPREAAGRQIAIEGYMTSQAKIVAVSQEDKSTTPTLVELPPGAPEDLAPYLVEGDGNYPSYRDGDILYVQRRPGAPANYLNRECLVTLSNGERFVRTILRGSRTGLFVLMGFNNPPMIDVEISAAAPIEWIKRG